MLLLRFLPFLSIDFDRYLFFYYLPGFFYFTYFDFFVFACLVLFFSSGFQGSEVLLGTALTTCYFFASFEHYPGGRSVLVL